MAPVADNVWLIDYIWRQYQVRTAAYYKHGIASSALPLHCKCSVSALARVLRSLSSKMWAGRAGESRVVPGTGGTCFGWFDDIDVPGLLEQPPLGQGHIPRSIAVGTG